MRVTTRHLVATLVIPTSLALGPIAHAASFGAVAEGYLELGKDIELDISFIGDTFTDALPEGGASADTDASVEDSSTIMGGGVLAESFASASGPQAGFADAQAESLSIISLNNGTDSAITAEFGFEYALDVFANFDGAAAQDAFAEASVNIMGGGIDESFAVFADALDGPTTADAFDTSMFSLTLAPGETVELEITALTRGGVAVVPLPPAIAVFAGALGALATFRRRLGNRPGRERSGSLDNWTTA